jgi:hypothetical protein
MAASEPTASVVSVGPLSDRAVAWIAGLVPVALAAVGLLILASTRDAPYPADSWGFRGFPALLLAIGPRMAGAPYEDRDRAALDAAVDAVAEVLADQGR